MNPAPQSFESTKLTNSLQWLNIKHCSFYSRGEEEPDGDEEEIRFVAQQSQLQSLTDLWSRILWNATNGKVSRDVVMGSTPSLDFSYIKLLGLLRTTCLEFDIKQCCSQSQCCLCKIRTRACSKRIFQYVSYAYSFLDQYCPALALELCFNKYVKHGWQVCNILSFS